MANHTGRIGTATGLCGAKEAGVTFRSPKWHRKQQRQAKARRRVLASLDAAREAAFDPTPRLVKP